MSEWELALADCHEWLKTIPDGSISAVITDPPYHTTQLAFDALEVRWADLWPEIYRVCKQNAVQVMFSAQPFTTDLINSNRKRFRYELIWEKTNPQGFLNANVKPLTAHENILVFGLTKGIYNPQMWQSIPKGIIERKRNQTHGKSQHYGKQVKDNVQINDGSRFPTSVVAVCNATRVSDDRHPTAKPLDLMTYLVKTYSNSGDTVLDLFAGSGTTLAACLHTGRKGIGCEISPEYHAIATRRLEAISAQGQLFALS